MSHAPDPDETPPEQPRRDQIDPAPQTETPPGGAGDREAPVEPAPDAGDSGDD